MTSLLFHLAWERYAAGDDQAGRRYLDVFFQHTVWPGVWRVGLRRWSLHGPSPFQSRFTAP